MFGLLHAHSLIATAFVYALLAQALPKHESRLERRAAVDLPTGWTDLGCHQDWSSPRILSGYSFSANNMTPRLCSNTCRSQGYVSIKEGKGLIIKGDVGAELISH